MLIMGDGRAKIGRAAVLRSRAIFEILSFYYHSCAFKLLVSIIVASGYPRYT
jgi:hypothetical protein